MTTAAYFRAALSTIVLVPLLSCCASHSTKRWTEEIKLDDGTIMQVQREGRFNETNALGGGAYNSIEQDSSIRFTGTLAALPPWSVSLRAHTLYKDSSTL